jgi:hypothetical protein
MSIDDSNGSVICNRDVIGLDPDELSILLVRFVHTQVSFSLSSLQEEPERRELGGNGSRDGFESGVRGEIWDEEEEGNGDRDGVG